MLAHERLRAWSLGHELTLAIYRATEGWPPQERYGLTSQLRRAAASVPTTLAEGSAKRGTREYRRFVDIALGSIIIPVHVNCRASDLGLLAPPDYATLDDLRKRTGGLIWRLARALDQCRP